ncbi:hypothetical protein NPIL_451561 [Nephila pilipes]|uniref:Uncharacterized protein n=1 Tax=Nephila pilipes TaxID=299642 RepID=A0A8X6N300_NEPPI|nr:hypothetical protein NPIL_451561 [Nephila pilipes]
MRQRSKVITTGIGAYIMSEYGGRVAFRMIGSMAAIYALVYGTYLSFEHLRKKRATHSKRNDCETTS